MPTEPLCDFQRDGQIGERGNEAQEIDDPEVRRSEDMSQERKEQERNALAEHSGNRVRRSVTEEAPYERRGCVKDFGVDVGGRQPAASSSIRSGAIPANCTSLLSRAGLSATQRASTPPTSTVAFTIEDACASDMPAPWTYVMRCGSNTQSGRRPSTASRNRCATAGGD